MVSFIFNWDKTRSSNVHTKEAPCAKYVIMHSVLVLLILDLKVAAGAQRRDKALM